MIVFLLFFSDYHEKKNTTQSIVHKSTDFALFHIYVFNLIHIHSRMEYLCLHTYNMRLCHRIAEILPQIHVDCHIWTVMCSSSNQSSQTIWVYMRREPSETAREDPLFTSSYNVIFCSKQIKIQFAAHACNQISCFAINLQHHCVAFCRQRHKHTYTYQHWGKKWIAERGWMHAHKKYGKIFSGSLFRMHPSKRPITNFFLSHFEATNWKPLSYVQLFIGFLYRCSFS